MQNAESVTAYLAKQPPAVRKTLAALRAVLRRALPKAEEVISYQMPAYRQHGEVLVYFAGWREHYALYPVNPAIWAKFEQALAGYPVSKGTIRLPYEKPVPSALVGRLAKFRLAQAKANEAAKAARKAAKKVTRRAKRS